MRSNAVVELRRTMPTTRYPLSSRSSARYEPSWPVIPVISAVGNCWKAVSPLLRKKGAPRGSPFRRFKKHGHATTAPRGARWTLPACKHRAQTFTRWIRPSITTRTTWRFGFQMRRVLLLAWETLFPTIGPLPVTSHTRAMWTLFLEQLAPAQSWRLQVFCSLTSPENGWRYPGSAADCETAPCSAKPAIIACRWFPDNAARPGPPCSRYRHW